MLSTESFKKISLPTDFSGGKARFAVLLGVAMLGALLLWWIWLWLLFDAQTIQQKTKAALSQHFGREVTLSDDVSLSLFPLPQVELYNLQIPNPPESRQPSMLLAPKLVGDIHFLSTLGGDLILDLQMIQPRFEIDNTPMVEDAAWLEQQQAALDPQAEIALISSAAIVRGKVHYQSPNYKKGVYLEDINGALNFESGGSGAGTFTFQLKQKYYQFKTEFGQSAGEKLPVFASLTDGTSTLSVQGEWTKATESFEGKHEFTSTDLAVLLENLAPQSALQAPPANGDASLPTYPIQTQGPVNYQQNRLSLQDFSVEGEHLKGKGAGTISLESLTDANLQIAFEKLSIDPLLERDSFTPFLISSAKKNLAAPWENDGPNLASKGFPENMKLLLTITSQQANVAGMPATSLQLQALMQDGYVDLKQLSGKLPGDTQFLLQGKIDESFDGIALRGKLDVSGLQFRQLMQKMVGKGLILPEDYARFRGRANMFISPRLVRFSEGILRVENTQLLGALIRYDESKNPASSLKKRYEGAFRVEDLDIDALASLQAQISQQDTGINAVEDPYPPIMHMLRRVTSRMQGDEYVLEFSLPRYRFHGEQRTNGSLKLHLKENLAEFQNIDTSYNGAKLRGDIRWDFTKEKPYFTAALSADRVDTEKFFDIELRKKDNFWLNPSSGEWSKAAFDLDTLYHYDGEFNFTLGQLQHGIHTLSNVKMQGALEDALLRFYDVEANLLGGTFVAKGGLHASKLPTFYGDFNMGHLDIRKLHSFTDIFDPIVGRFNLSGNFTTAGVNIYSMIQNAQGSLSLAGGGVTLKGFNLENMVRAANAVRTVDDIDKLVKYAQQGGETRISSLQGSLNLGNGTIQSPGMKIATRLGNGSISGQMNLMDWNINASVILYLQALQERSPPNIKLIFDGPVQAAERRLETESLESFIARKAAKRLLTN
jgi:uncharacterized protein involved in outer membrane biogenesis